MIVDFTAEELAVALAGCWALKDAIEDMKVHADQIQLGSVEAELERLDAVRASVQAKLKDVLRRVAKGQTGADVD